MTGARVVDGAVTLRERRGDDETFLRDLYESTRDDLAAVDWPSEQLDAILALQWAAQKEGYRALHPAASDQIVELDGEAVGRILVDTTGSTTTIVDVALLPGARGRGLGTRLLEGVLAGARQHRSRVVLHVERSNRARHLYERLGFTVDGERGLHVAMAWTP